MLKKYWKRNKDQPIMIAQEQDEMTEGTHGEDHPKTKEDPPIRLDNSKILEKLGTKLEHLPEGIKQKLEATIREYRDIFADTLRQTNAALHDVVLTTEQPIRQHPYRLNPRKLKILQEEIAHMMKHGII